VTFFNDLERSAERGTTFKQSDKGSPKVVHYFLLCVFTHLRRLQNLLKSVIYSISVDIEAVVDFIDGFCRNILTFEVFFVNLELLDCPQRPSFVDLNPQPHIILALLIILRVQSLIQPHLKQGASLLRILLRMYVRQIGLHKHFALVILRIAAVVVLAYGLVGGEVGAAVSFSVVTDVVGSLHRVGAFEVTQFGGVLSELKRRHVINFI
jgi:hypothetical protein